MKVFIDMPNPVDKALGQVISTMFGSICNICNESNEADLIIVGDKIKLQKHFNENKFFAVFAIKEVPNLPEKARWIPILEYISPLARYLKQIEKEISSSTETKTATQTVQTGKEFSPLEINEKSQHILVIDDTPENLDLAINLLGENHFVTLASGFNEGLNLIRKNKYDVVLSDCQMLPDTENSALSIDGIKIGETVHNGIFMIFLATKYGARVAIVTDANHHKDWVSALFDDKDLREPQEVNGQPVLLINYMDKNWDLALEKINTF